MQDVLGYRRFAASGGDWGSVVTAYLSHAHANEVIGTHLTFPALLAISFNDVAADDYGPDEEGWYDRARNERVPLAAAHIAPHSNDPQSLAHGLNDSPAGLAAWLLERRCNLADTREGIESRYTKDELCTIASVYWFTQSIGTSMRFYADSHRHTSLSGITFPLFHDRSPVLEAPTAVSVFPYELWLMPESVVQKYANLQQFVAHDRGGHYAAFEEPELWLDDVRTFFRGLR
jgi:pimeloyl-ACP methyl ester carboxylesterase